ncbi:MAG: PAS domain S-box protein [Chloroflexota bacterium]|nr:PAS domain S-box protein [Chloroflexota bacterium]
MQQREKGRAAGAATKVREEVGRYIQLIDDVNEGYVIIHGMRIVFANKRCHEYVGLACGSLIGRPFIDLVSPQSRAEAMRLYRSSAGGRGLSEQHELALTRSDGSTFIAELRFREMVMDGHKVVAALIRDITERKQAEEALKASREKYHRLLEDLSDGFIVFQDGGVVYANSRCSEILGYGPEAIGQPFTSFIPPRLAERVSELREKAARGEFTEWPLETIVLNKDGVEVPVEVSGRVAEYEGRPAFNMLIRDISERERAEEACRDSQEFSASLLASSPNPIIVLNQDASVRYINPALETLTGYSSPEVIGTVPPFPWWTEETGHKTGKDLVEAMGVGARRLEQRFQRKDGERFWVEITAEPVRSNGELKHFISNWVDITERKRAEEALQESKQLLQRTFDGLRDAVFVLNADEVEILDCNDAATEVFGYSREEMLGHTAAFLYVDEQDLDTFRSFLYPAVDSSGFLSDFEFRMKRKDGAIFPTEHTVVPLDDEEGRHVGWVGVVRDITKRKRAEDALTESEERYRNLFNSSLTGTLLTELDGTIIAANWAGAGMLGCSPGELVGRNIAQFYRYPNSREQILAEIAHGTIISYETDMVRDDGTTMTALVHSTTVDFQGRKALLTSGLDITERKRAEEAVAESEGRYRNLVVSSLDAILIVQGQEVKFVNPAALGVFGVEREDDIVGHPFTDFVAPEYRDLMNERGLSREAGGDAPGRYEFRALRRDGTQFDAEISVSAVSYDGSVARQGIVRDVTERKRAEEVLRRSEQKYRTAIEAARDGIVIIALDGTMVDTNEANFRALGFESKEGLLGRNLFDFISPRSARAARKAMDAALKKGHGVQIEGMALSSAGTEIPVEVGISLLRGEEAQPQGFFMVVRDITRRQRIQEELLRQNRQLAALHAIAATVSQTLDLDELLEGALTKVQEVMDADASAIYLADWQRRQVVLKSHRGYSDAFRYRDRVWYIGDEEVEQVVGLVELPVAVEAVLGGANTSRMAETLKRERIKSHIAAGMWSRGVLHGVIIASNRSERLFTTEDVDLLNAIGNQIAVAVENARLFQETQYRAEQMSVMAELTRIIGSSLDIGRVYETFTDGLGRLLQFDRASIALVEEGMVRFLAVSSEVKTELETGVLVPQGGTAMEWVMEHKRTNIEADFAQEMLFPVDEAHLRSGLRSAIRVPLYSKGQIVGTFNLSSCQPGAYGEREREIVEELAGRIAVAIENNRLFGEIREGKEELQAAYDKLLTSNEALERSKEELEDAYLKVAKTLVIALEARDYYTRGHSERVAQISRRIAAELGFSTGEIATIERAAMLHDLGKIGIPDAILLKPGPLTPSERVEVQLHPTKSVDMLRHLAFLRSTLPIIEHHHEHYNGKGYPHCLKDEDIPVGARILAVADAYDAMTSARPYRAMMSSEEAIDVLKEGAGTQWDPQVIDAFLRAFGL